MTSPMYKNGVEMDVTDDEDGRAVLAAAGWTEDVKQEEVKEEPKQEKLSMPKASKDDDSK